MLLHVFSYSLVFSLLCLKLSNEKAFLVRTKTETKNEHQYSNDESSESDLSNAKGNDYQDGNGYQDGNDYQDYFDYQILGLNCTSPIYVGDTSCEDEVTTPPPPPPAPRSPPPPPPPPPPPQRTCGPLDFLASWHCYFRG